MVMDERNVTVFCIDDDDDDDDGVVLERQLLRIPDRAVDFDYDGNPETAIARLRERHADFVFVDYHLGALDGREVLQQLREVEYIRPIIMLTGHRHRREIA